MFNWKKRNIKINEDSKILIGLGDSFTQGTGACSLELWEKYNWNINEINKIKNIEVLESNYENSWVNKICKNHLTDFIPINFGLQGKGNRATLKELYLHPDLGIERAKEIIVVFMLSGYERFDFINSEYHEHGHFVTMWPNMGEKVPQKELWDAYVEHIWSDRFGVMELLLNMMEVQMWCKSNNARCVFLSSFTPNIRREKLIEIIKGEDKKSYLYQQNDYIESLIDSINWDNFLYINNKNCVSDYLLELENKESLINDKTSWSFHEFAFKFDKLSPKKYITKCAHPSYNGHIKIAEQIYKFLI